MKRVLCIIESLGSGGAERQLTGLAAMLVRRGYTVRMLYYVRQDFYLPYLTENGVDVRCVADGRSPITRMFMLWRAVRRFEPDTVIAYTPSASSVVCLFRFLGGKFKAIVSERSTTVLLNGYERRRFSLFRWSDVIVPNSFSQAKFITDNFPRLAGKIQVITNFVDTEIFKPSVRSPHDGKIRMICVGRLSEEKNVLLFLDAVSEMVSRRLPIEINWYGNQDRPYGEKCLKKVREMCLDGIITFHKESRDIVGEYRRSDLFCLPSLFEGFPNVVCEAMSCGLPVLCSDVCDNPRIVEEGQNGFLFNPTCAEEIVACVQRYLDMGEDEKAEMRKRNRRKAVEMFSPQKFIEKYCAIIDC